MGPAWRTRSAGLEGTGKTARHVKLRSVEDVARPGVGRLIERAAEAAGDR